MFHAALNLVTGWLGHPSREDRALRTPEQWCLAYRGKLGIPRLELAEQVDLTLGEMVSNSHRLDLLVAAGGSESVRVLAAIKSGLTKDMRCEPALIAALNDHSATLRRTAAVSLCLLGTVRGLSAVVSGTHHGHAVRADAANLLRLKGPKAYEAIPALIQLICYRKTHARSHEAAAAALVAVGDSALPYIELMLLERKRYNWHALVLALAESAHASRFRNEIEEFHAQNRR